LERAQHRFYSGGADPAASWTYRWAGSTTSRQTATAADTLEIDMTPRHQRNTRAVVGGGHGAIVPRMVTS